MSTAGLVLAFGLLGAVTGASAHDDRRPCSSCGAGVTTRYKIIHPVQYVTRYHDRSVYHHVTRLHYIVDVTRIQPIVNVRDVTRIHHHTLVSVRDVYAYPVQAPAPLAYVQQSTVNAYGCGCGSE